MRHRRGIALATALRRKVDGHSLQRYLAFAEPESQGLLSRELRQKELDDAHRTTEERPHCR